MPGESVKGHIPLELIEQLLDNGMIGEEESDTSEQETPKVEGDYTSKLPPNLSPVNVGDTPAHYPTLEEFKTMLAPAQKALLESLEIEPGSRLEDRYEQYVEWVAKQAGEGNEQL